MAQVSDSSASSPEAFGSIQTRSPNPIRKLAEDNTGSKRVVTQEQAKEAQQASREEDKVQISREAQDQGRGNRVVEGERNADSLRPQPEQIENERGSAQKLRDLQNSNARGVRDFDEAENQVKPEEPSANRNNGAEQPSETQVSASGAEKNERIIEQQASDRKSAEVQLRQFQTRNEVRIEPQIVAESVEEIEYQREKAEAAQEPALKPPSQKVLETVPQSERTEAIKEQVNQEGSRKEPPNPVSAQTETGQNVDDLI
jgi:hypothetical protein